MRRRLCKTSKGLSTGLKQIIGTGLTNDKIQFVCIGTDRSTGDSLAPLVGTLLEAYGYTNVIGTIDKPFHNMNKDERMSEINPKKTVIAIDVALSDKSPMGTLIVQNGAITMGSAVRKLKEHEVRKIGDYCIKGCIAKYYNDKELNMLTLNSSRLSDVMKMAKHIVEAIIQVYPCRKLSKV